MHFQDPDRNALVRLFLEASEEGLAAMEEGMAALEKRPGDAAALDALDRVLGAFERHAATIGLADVAQITREVEDVLAQLRAGTLTASRQVVDLLLASVAALREKLAEARG